jgi:DNA-binding FrmR family transcriptional regulator
VIRQKNDPEDLRERVQRKGEWILDRRKLINRLNRTEGQIRGIAKMMEEERDCRDVVIQLAAVRAGVDKVINLIVTENLLDCVLKDGEEVGREQLENALELIFKIR